MRRTVCILQVPIDELTHDYTPDAHLVTYSCEESKWAHELVEQYTVVATEREVKTIAGALSDRAWGGGGCGRQVWGSGNMGRRLGNRDSHGCACVSSRGGMSARRAVGFKRATGRARIVVLGDTAPARAATVLIDSSS